MMVVAMGEIEWQFKLFSLPDFAFGLVLSEPLRMTILRGLAIQMGIVFMHSINE